MPSNAPTPLHVTIPTLPASWSGLTWKQLCGCWQCKMRYGGNADVAQAAALLELCGLTVDGKEPFDKVTGEDVYRLNGADGNLWTVTARELSQMAHKALQWFQYPYGDPGEPVVKDENGRIVKEARNPVRGYVNDDFRDALALPEDTIVIVGSRLLTGSEWQSMSDHSPSCLHFSLPSVACYSITWQQYRSLQAIAALLIQEGMSDSDVLDLQAQFMAHILVPAKKPSVTEDPFAPPHDFTYDPDRAEQTVAFWRKRLEQESSVLFHILFQVYQTALTYYAQVFPLLFNGDGKNDPLQDALTGEVRTLNAVMKYQGYTKPEDVYDENLPNILSTLNTMAEEAKQIEQMNARIRSKK